MERKKEVVLVVVVTCLLFGVKIFVSNLKVGAVGQDRHAIVGKTGLKGEGDHSRWKQGESPAGDEAQRTADGSSAMTRLGTPPPPRGAFRPSSANLISPRQRNLPIGSRVNNYPVTGPGNDPATGNSQSDVASLDKGRQTLEKMTSSDKNNTRNLSETFYRFAPQIFDGVPERFLTEFKNPCWWAGRGDVDGDPRLRCLPYFFLAGMPKSGTTDVHGKLLRHPEIIKSSMKEPHWWTRRRFQGQGVDDYIEQQSLNIVANLRNGGDPNTIIGDSSASTFWENAHWRDIFPGVPTGPPQYLAQVIGTVLPDAKIIVIFRNPVERLYSDYNYFHSFDRTRAPSRFHLSVLRFIRAFESCLNKTRSQRTCAYDLQSLPAARMSIGMYSIYLRDWLEVFPRDQIKVLRLEDWHTNCTRLLPELYDFLNLSKVDDATTTRICSKRASNVNKREVNPMLPETRRILAQFYQPLNSDLAAMVDDDRYLWEDSF